MSDRELRALERAKPAPGTHDRARLLELRQRTGRPLGRTPAELARALGLEDPQAYLAARARIPRSDVYAGTTWESGPRGSGRTTAMLLEVLAALDRGEREVLVVAWPEANAVRLRGVLQNMARKVGAPVPGTAPVPQDVTVPLSLFPQARRGLPSAPLFPDHSIYELSPRERLDRYGGDFDLAWKADEELIRDDPRPRRRAAALAWRAENLRRDLDWLRPRVTWSERAAPGWTMTILRGEVDGAGRETAISDYELAQARYTTAPREHARGRVLEGLLADLRALRRTPGSRRTPAGAGLSGLWPESASVAPIASTPPSEPSALYQAYQESIAHYMRETEERTARALAVPSPVPFSPWWSEAETDRKAQAIRFRVGLDLPAVQSPPPSALILDPTLTHPPTNDTAGEPPSGDPPAEGGAG